MFGSVLTIVTISLFTLSTCLVSGQQVSETPPEISAQEITKEQTLFFENKIRPLLSKNCYSCHGPKTQKYGLRVDSREAMLEGGDSGEILVPGDLDDSLIIDALTRDEGQMPPKKRLSEEQINDVKRWVKMGAPWPAGSPHRTEPTFSAEDKNYWAFQPLVDSQPKRAADDNWSRNEIDYFVRRNLLESGVQPAKSAAKSVLLRRLYFDLIGVPPTISEQESFLQDPDPKAYEKRVDQLLQDPRYGEKWGRHWLDLVRYADSDGYKQDDYRPHAWRYRDYVIQSLNDDKPYDQFVREQLAGDEMDPGNPEYLIATGYLRHWIYEYNQRDVRTQWETILNDVTNVTGDVFMAMSMNCARCHDHKFDPILQKDYYRLQAFFAPLLPRDDLPLATPAEQKKYQQQNEKWLAATSEIRRQLDQLEEPFQTRKMTPEIEKFPLDIRPMMRKKSQSRSPFETQLTDLAFRQVKKLTADELKKKMKGDVLKNWTALREELKKFDPLKPKPLPVAFTVTDTGPNPPVTQIPDSSDDSPVAPGILSVIDASETPASPPASNPNSTGRRTALANWLTRPENGLTTRVIVNRIWQNHFGTGIVASASDFGKLGARPADPKLLDWLAVRFVQNGWKFKSLHRMILLSATYRQAALSKPDSKSSPKGLIPFRPSVRRLQAEQIRDAMLAVSGELDIKRGGPGADSSNTRRTIYNKIIRNRRDPFLDVFDAPDNFNSTAQRNVTTTPNQSLLMLNSQWTMDRAKAMAKRLQTVPVSKDKKLDSEKSTVATGIDTAYRLAFSRSPTPDELASAQSFLGEKPGVNDWEDFCHVLLNSNEFLYID